MVRRTAIRFSPVCCALKAAARAIAPDLTVGVDGITTNDPGGLIVHLKAKGMR